MRKVLLGFLHWLIYQLEGEPEPERKPARITYYSDDEYDDPRNYAVGDDW